VAEISEFRSGLHRTVREGLLKNQEPNLSKRGAEIFRSGGVRNMLSLRPFTHGVPETRFFPIALWERLERQVLKGIGNDVLLQCDPQGVQPLRQAIADYVNLERGARATADRVLVLTSSQQAMMLCANLLLDPGDHIFIEDPAYHGARKAFDAGGVTSLPVQLDQNGVLVDQILTARQQAKAVFLTPSHQFPTGATLSLDRRLALIDWASQNQAWIIEDDYDSEFHYAGKPTACVQGLDPHDRTIYIGTFTKSLFPGLRIGYAVLPPQLVTPMTVARTLMDGHTATITQYTLARFMENGHFGAYVRTMRGIYSERLKKLVSLVKTHLSDFVEALVPAGGLQLPCFLNCGLPEKVVINAARRIGIDLMGLSSLHANAVARPGFLMGFAAFTPAELESAVIKLSKEIRTLS